MTQLKDRLIHVSVATAVAIILFMVALFTGVLSFGRTAGGVEAQLNDNTKKIKEIEPLISRIPVLEEAVSNLKNDVSYTRKGVDDIKNLLLRK